MKVKGYIVSGKLKMLVIPANADGNDIPTDAKAIIDSADRVREFELDESCIGLDRDAAKRGIDKNGYFINTAEMKIREVE